LVQLQQFAADDYLAKSIDAWFLSKMDGRAAAAGSACGSLYFPTGKKHWTKVHLLAVQTHD